MILPAPIAAGVRAGTVSVAYRRWAQPRVAAGQTFISAAGVVRIESVDLADPAALTDADATRAGYRSAERLRTSLRGPSTNPVFRIGLSWAGEDPRLTLREDLDVTGVAERLARLDRRAPWTLTYLRLIEANPAVRAADLAEVVGLPRDDFKLNVRKLKSLGLTISLDVGYRLSPRGTAYLRSLGD